jgi:hypothetical protein
VHVRRAGKTGPGPVILRSAADAASDAKPCAAGVDAITGDVCANIADPDRVQEFWPFWLHPDPCSVLFAPGKAQENLPAPRENYFDQS